jgi:hypothetical protein
MAVDDLWHLQVHKRLPYRCLVGRTGILDCLFNILFFDQVVIESELTAPTLHIQVMNAIDAPAMPS